VPNYDDLLGEAQARLREQEENSNEELGERVALERGEHFLGRWRGEITMHTKDGDSFPVYGLWDSEGQPRFHYRNAALADEIAECNPAIGDVIVIVRGEEDYEFEFEGESRTKHRYAVRTRSSSEPLPGKAEIPF
jgi:hypothetical protein